MSAILNYLNGHNSLIFQPILMTLVSKFMVYRALTNKIYVLLGLRSPLTGKRDNAGHEKTTINKPVKRCKNNTHIHFICTQKAQILT